MYNYVTVKLPSNGLLYNVKEVHLRQKTIFDIKALLDNPIFQLKSEIDAINNCLDPRDNINVYDFVNQDVVYLLYKLRSLSDDNLTLNVNDVKYDIKISELPVKYLESFDNVITLPESNKVVSLTYVPIRLMFNLEREKRNFLAKYPEYHSDVVNTVLLLNVINNIDSLYDKERIRIELEKLSWKDSIHLIDKIEKLQNLDFGIVEEVNVKDPETNESKKVKIQLTSEFFRPTL